MKIPFGTISITDESKALIGKILESGRVSSGKYVGEFEQKFAEQANAKEAVAVSSGTDADILALAVLHDFGAERGDEIIVPALSFVAVGNAVLHAGFKPVFVDINKETLNINASKIANAITEKTRAILAVHTMGKPADMALISEIAKKHNLFLIEDAAEAHGAELNGRKVGEFGDLATYSSYLAHMVSTIEGGIVTTRRSDFGNVLRSLRSHGRACDCRTCLLNIQSGYCPKRFNKGEDIRFLFDRIGYSSKMNEIEAAVGIGNLNIYKDIFEKRRKNLLSMIDKFARFKPYLSTFKEDEGEIIGPHAFPLIIEKGAPFTRKQLVDHLEKNGIETRHLFSSMPTQCKGFGFLGHKLGEFPEAEYIGGNGLHIGVHQDLNEEHVDYFIDTVDKFVSENV